MSIIVNDNIDHTKQRGVSRVHHQFMDALSCEFGDAIESYRNPYLNLIRDLRSRYIRVPDIGAMYTVWKSKARIFYAPHYGYIESKAKKVITVYDMILERFPNYFSPRYLTYRWEIEDKRRCIERADTIIAISESTANDILEIYPQVDPAMIKVVHLGVDNFFFDAVPNPSIAPYLLYVGHRSQYKNFRRLLTAFGRSGLAHDFELHVISPSGSGFTLDEIAEMQHLSILNRVKLKASASEDELRRSYANAYAFIYPSEAEGFGLPILEALASGTLVATSNHSSMPEVGGTVAFYFDPHDMDSLAGCLQHLAQLGETERATRIASGRIRARGFSWERTRSQVGGIFHDLMA
jgi:glycosyltransferase involved in cell wall biosynthesis